VSLGALSNCKNKSNSPLEEKLFTYEGEAIKRHLDSFSKARIKWRSTCKVKEERKGNRVMRPYLLLSVDHIDV
jgi:hypothetical protein